MIIIRETFDIVTHESAALGDFAESGWIDETGVAFTTVKEAIEYLRENGAVHASSSVFHNGIWYSADATQDIHDGSEETRSFHLTASEETQRLIYNGLFPKVA